LHISSSSTCAGVAATAGELAKDQRHQDIVEEEGCDFIPLIVETFGIWSRFALKFIILTSLQTAQQPEVALPLDRQEETCCSNYQCHFGPE